MQDRKKGCLFTIAAIGVHCYALAAQQQWKSVVKNGSHQARLQRLRYARVNVPPKCPLAGIGF